MLHVAVDIDSDGNYATTIQSVSDHKAFEESVAAVLDQADDILGSAE